MEKFAIKVDTKKTYLSSESQLYKTENFIKQTKYIVDVDFFISKIAENIVKNADMLLKDCGSDDKLGCFLAQTSDKLFSLMFKFGEQLGAGLNKKDIVFFDYISSSKIRQNDQRIADYIKTHASINVDIKQTKSLTKIEEFNKLYLISSSGVNLPRLSAEQKKIVETIDQNVLVQGVAGSGKTNVCIDKIIFSACRNYGGKVLYTTYSRGLLVDTKLKIDAFKNQLEKFVQDYKQGGVVFLDENHKKALENKFGIYFFSDDDDKILAKIKRIIEFLETRVDYFLLEDIYKNQFKKEPVVANEQYFVKKYAVSLKNHQIAKCLKKVERFSLEVVYKEIFGMILGSYDLKYPKEMLTMAEYVSARKDSFSREDCEAIYQIALDYKKHCEQNGLLDNNSISKLLLSDESLEKYSLSIVDEVQDYTEVCLCVIKKMSIKVFCVGDALQMINPTYFSFGYLKNLLFEKDLTSVSELKNNYRNTKKIEEIIDGLSEINKQEFGTHNFVLKGCSVESGIKTKAVYVNDDGFIKLIASGGFDNFTFVVSNQYAKESLKKTIKNQEILTVSEIKGLERGTVVLFNVLSDNFDKWSALERNKVNHKNADENSVYRYYFNLFYVGVSRAKQNIFVVENKTINLFSNFFAKNFETKNKENAILELNEIVSKIEFTQAEILSRVEEFIKLEQFDNAKFTANKINDDKLRINALNKISVYENFIHFGKYREAGIRFWELGMIAEAKQQFEISGDKKLIELVDACSEKSDDGLSVDIVEYFEDVKNNEMARNFIVETVQRDVEKLRSSFKQIKQNFRSKKETKNGK
jgi:hypothetical protein